MTSFKATSKLSNHERDWISDYLGNRPWFDFYWQCSLDDLDKGLDNRSYLISTTETGLILAIHFEGVSIYSTVGKLDSRDLLKILDRPERAEIHIEPSHSTTLLKLGMDRIRREDAIRYYWLENPDRSPSPGNRSRKITGSDFASVKEFFEKYYPETVLSTWMLELPMVGVWQDGRLLAVAGTLVINKRLAACHIGSFLTHPDHRGRGLAKEVAKGLFHILVHEGVLNFSLGVYESNAPACRAYESLGFQLLEVRPLIYLNEKRN